MKKNLKGTFVTDPFHSHLHTGILNFPEYLEQSNLK